MTRFILLATVGLAALLLASPSYAQNPILPDKDPDAQGAAVKYLLANQHPRLLFTADRIAQLKGFYNSPEGKLYHDQIEGYVADCTVPANRANTDVWGQTYGLFKLPMVALHYTLTKDKTSFDKSVAYLKWLAGTANWTSAGEPAVEDTPEAYAKVLEKMKQFGPEGERNSDTTASFTMVGAALTWDWLYNDLDPAFREQFRQILWQHARAMYYGGHKGANPDGFYWRSVPTYNHRWYRDWGMTLAALASAEGKPQEQWFLGDVEKELKFMADWLPPDGSLHEGPGYGACSGGLGMAMEVSDELTGTHYLQLPFFANVGNYQLHLAAPGWAESLYFADCFTTCRAVHPFFLKTAAMNKQADVADGIRHFIQVNGKRWAVRDYGWLSLLCDDPTVKGGQYTKLPTTAFIADLGISISRDSWDNTAVAAMFKCGPMGGYTANAWRATKKNAAGVLPYLNVAHDHPDANSFSIFGDGDYMAETDRYPLNPGKLSTGHNTILINGLGQAADGRPEGNEWQQPGNGSMTEMGKITAFKDAGNVVVTEGEAAGSYLPVTSGDKSRPALDRFRRTFIWVKGDYILVFDDVRAPESVEATYLMQGAKLEPTDAAQGRYRLTKNHAQCDFQLLADLPLKSKIAVSTANDHKTMLNWQQLQASAQGNAVRFVSVFNPWHKKDLTVTFKPDGADKATITVSGDDDIIDTWQWQAAKSKFEAATWHGSRAGGFDVSVDAKTPVPQPPGM